MALAYMVTTHAMAANITGLVTVKQRLTRPRVTASASVYERGPGVKLGKDAETDPLAAERARVVIYVEGEEGAVVGEPEANAGVPVSIQQTNRRFEPEIAVVRMGSAVTFPNMDPIFHNVFSLSKPRSFDLGNYPKGETRTVKFPKPGIVYVNCRLHPNMAAVIVVTPNQWHTRAGRDGQFALHNLPTGTFTLVAWHKATGSIRKQVRVEEGQDTVVDFLVPLDSSADGPDADQRKVNRTGR
jgi:plastocyanin